MNGAKRVTGNDMLRAVRRANLFLVPLDPEGVWFRYHHLFTNLLRIRLQQVYTQAQIRDLHARAAAWFAAHALADEAIAHFLPRRRCAKRGQADRGTGAFVARSGELAPVGTLARTVARRD